jgi:hypothetical protein
MLLVMIRTSSFFSGKVRAAALIMINLFPHNNIKYSALLTNDPSLATTSSSKPLALSPQASDPCSVSAAEQVNKCA